MLYLPGKDLSRGLSCCRFVYIPLRPWFISRPAFYLVRWLSLNSPSGELLLARSPLTCRRPRLFFRPQFSDRRSNSRGLCGRAGSPHSSFGTLVQRCISSIYPHLTGHSRERCRELVSGWRIFILEEVPMVTLLQPLTVVGEYHWKRFHWLRKYL